MSRSGNAYVQDQEIQLQSRHGRRREFCRDPTRCRGNRWEKLYTFFRNLENPKLNFNDTVHVHPVASSHGSIPVPRSASSASALVTLLVEGRGGEGRGEWNVYGWGKEVEVGSLVWVGKEEGRGVWRGFIFSESGKVE